MFVCLDVLSGGAVDVFFRSVLFCGYCLLVSTAVRILRSEVRVIMLVLVLVLMLVLVLVLVPALVLVLVVLLEAGPSG